MKSIGTLTSLRKSWIMDVAMLGSKAEKSVIHNRDQIQSEWVFLLLRHSYKQITEKYSKTGCSCT